MENLHYDVIRLNEFDLKCFLITTVKNHLIPFMTSGNDSDEGCKRKEEILNLILFSIHLKFKHEHLSKNLLMHVYPSIPIGR